jgi:hypothetical protein
MVSQTNAAFYVAPNGSDTWSGTLPQSADDGSDGPFATLARARDAVRGLRAGAPQDNVRVLIRGGLYVLDETVVFGLEDGAADSDATITYSAFPGEVPVFSSGVAITGWRELDDWKLPLPSHAKQNVWVADIPDGLGRFYTLYDGDRRLARARSDGFAPTEPYLLPEQLWALTGSVKGPHPDLDSRLAFPPGAIRDWDNLDDVELLIRPNYPSVINYLSFASVDEEAGIARTTIPATYPMRQLYNRFTGFGDAATSAWVENILEALDRPGAWVLNTHTRKLYYWPIGDHPGSEIRAPRLRELIRIEGQIDVDGPADTPVRGIVLEGLWFTQGDRDVWLADDAGIQHDFEMVDKANGLVRLRGAERCVVRRCRFYNSGGCGLRLDLHCQDNLVEQNELCHLGSAGIAVIGYGPGTKDVSKRNRIIDNNIHRIGEIFWHAHGIVLSQSGENIVAHNYLHHVPREAIAVAGSRPEFFDRSLPLTRECARMIRWQEVGDAQTWDEVLPFLHGRNNLIELNEIYRPNSYAGDGTAINLSGAGEGNVVRRNWIHHILNPNVHGALRADDFQNGTTFEENVVFRTNSGGLMIRLRNSWINNVIVDVDPANYIWFGQQVLDGTVLRGNIFFHPGPEAPWFGIMWRPAGMNPFDRLAAARNTDVRDNIFFSAGSDAARQTLAELDRRGLARGSAVVDPQFVDWSSGDLRLAPGSPALGMGIRSVDIREAGLTPDFPVWLRSVGSDGPADDFGTRAPTGNGLDQRGGVRVRGVAEDAGG